MTISIHIGAIYDIETYDGLIEYIRNALELDDDTYARLPTLIRLAEYRLNRLCIAPEREVRTALATVAGQPYVDLPSGFRQARSVYLDGSYTMAFANPEAVQGDFVGQAGKPQVYTIQNQQMWLAPIPGGVHTIDLTYLERIPGLSTTNQSNWLLRGNADAYVYSVIFQVAVYLEDKQLAPWAEEELFRIIGEVNQQANRFRNGGPLRMRASVVV